MVYPARKNVIRTFAKLIERLPATERSKPQIFLLAGAVTPFRDDTDRELPFRQESNFFYLSGCTVPSSFLIAASQSGTSLAAEPAPTTPAHTGTGPAVELFIPKAELEDMMWSLPPPSLEAAIQTHDVSTVAYTADLDSAIERYIKAFPDALFHTLPAGSLLFPTLLPRYTAPVVASGTAAVSDAYLLSALHEARLVKSPGELDKIRKANAISSRAHEVVMRMLGKAVSGELKKSTSAQERPLLPGEWLIEKEGEAEAVFVASCRREGAVHQAYLPICASSTRAATLHYCCNDKAFAWGPVRPQDHRNHRDFQIARGGESGHELQPQVLLIDAGCEWECYASDITRTMPVGNGGKFAPETRAIYELVLEMQKASFDLVKAGVHWDLIQLTCHKVLVKGFQRLGIFLSPSSRHSGSWNAEEAILASGVTSAFFPHGVGHSLGLDVHDVPSASKPTFNKTVGDVQGHESFYTYLRLRLPLEAGMVVTVEPGIYFSPHLLEPVRQSKHIDHEVLQRYESVGGIRIEDVIVVTDHGYENFTTVRSDVEWIEGVCSGAI